MKASDSFSQISYSTLQTHLHSYEAHVPEKIHGLEEFRLREVPETLDQRKKDSNAFLEKTEVTTLVEWKLKHGTYRPNLAKLVASNTVKDVRETTKSAFATYESNNADYSKAVTALSTLKGIGPATASLLLSCYDPVKVPFFADEVYRYFHWEEAKNKGWDRKIKYTMKEYKDLFDKMQILQERLENESGEQVTAIEIEKMAYVLSKQAQKRDFLDMDDDDRALQPPKSQKPKVPDLSEVPQAVCLQKGPDGSPNYDKTSESEEDQESGHPPAKRQKRATQGKPKKVTGGRKKANGGSTQLPDDFARIEECRRKGLNGSPTYDTLGFELDKDFIIKHTGGRPRPLGKKALDRLDQKREESEIKAKIIGSPGDNTTVHEEAWDDRVARDLGIAYHQVGMEEYEEWLKKGFKAYKKEFDLSNKERDRLMDLMGGSALRKGSKHR